ncbi:MAG: VWA domain-containing protein, partial [Beijerinckiaceae bacterium]|nr:VWA domain-containing protein [Beijerinckiaceae bacterium]
MDDLAAPPDGAGRLGENILHFARLLRAAGLPVGPGHVIDAVEAVLAAGVASREDFRTTLHAVFVAKRDQTVIFDQAFAIFWKRRGFLEKLIAMMSPMAAPDKQEAKPKPGATRMAEALAGDKPKRE